MGGDNGGVVEEWWIGGMVEWINVMTIMYCDGSDGWKWWRRIFKLEDTVFGGTVV